MAPTPSGDRLVYTALIGRYEALNEQPVAHGSALRFICLTDDPDLRSDSWEVILVEPAFPSDPVRSARRLKVLGDPRLRGADETLYIDNSVILRVPPEQILDDWLEDVDFAAPTHSYRDQLADEFEAVVDSGFDEPARVFEQARHYLEEIPGVMAARPLWAALIARRMTPPVEALQQRWFDDILRYSRRDQLSMVAALMRTEELRWRAVELDNLGSPLHLWPVTDQRDRGAGKRTPGQWQQPLALELRSLRRRDAAQSSELAELRFDVVAAQEQSIGLVESVNHREALLRAREDELAQSRADVGRLSSELDSIHRSRTWRVARVVRAAVRALHPRRRAGG